MTAADIELARAADGLAILARRGITLTGRRGWRCGPCPRCGGTDRFSVHPVRRAFKCRGCYATGGDVISLVGFLDGLDVRKNFQLIVERILTESKDDGPVDYDDEASDAEQHSKALSLWRRRRPIAGTIAEVYLRTRGITGPLPETLAFLPPGKREQHPAMIAPFAIDAVNPVDSIHLTFLKPDGGGKADVERAKIVVGRPLDRPIVLAAPNDLGGLLIAEGIEDALTGHEATGLGAWGAGSASFMPALADYVPSYVEVVTIIQDADQAGRSASQKLAQRLIARGLEVIMVEP
jgi:putative DNA primase/helicase